MKKSTDINDVTSLGRYDICCKTINLYFFTYLYKLVFFWTT